MLIKDFYTIAQQQSTGEGQYEISVKLNPEAAVYKGHFPGQPVAPGVCLVQMVKELANGVLSEQLQLKEAQQIKFLAAADPNKIELLTIILELQQQDSSYRLKCIAKEKDTTYFKISGTLA